MLQAEKMLLVLGGGRSLDFGLGIVYSACSKQWGNLFL